MKYLEANYARDVLPQVGAVKGKEIPMRSFVGKVLAVAALTVSSFASAEMGRTEGSWGVSPTGAATYSIPLWVQPGPKGIQPSLSVNYNSQSGNGTMGVGWWLGGFGFIERCAQTVGEDGIDKPITVTAADRFCIGGNKLRITSGPVSSYGSAGAIYQTQIADFSRITSVGTAGTGPLSWTVHTKDGLIYEYGNTADSRFIITGASVYRWFLNKVSDRDGNSYIITYSTSNAVGRVPLSVQWGPTTAGGSTYQYKATLNYTNKSNDKDVVWAHEQGFANPTKQRLGSVQIGYSATGSSYVTKRQYVFAYEQSPTTSQSRLTEIQECAEAVSDATCLKPTSIAYQNGAAGVKTTPSTAVSSGVSLVGKYDFNGDGRSDIAYFSGSTWRVAFSTGAGFTGGVDTGITGSSTPAAGRFIANHQDAFLVNVSGSWSYVGYNGSSFSTTPTSTPVATGSYLTDYNGDGLQDIVWATASSGAGGWTGYINLRLNTSSGSAAAPTFDTNTYTPFAMNLGNFGGNISIIPVSKCPVERLCDLNGDGAGDFSVVVTTTLTCTGGPGGCTPVTTGYDIISNGGTYYLASGVVGSAQPFLGLRFNDDRCTDAITMSTLKMRVSGCGAGPSASVTLPATPVGVIDWDADGNTDLLVNNGGTIGVYKSKGNISSPFSSLVSTSIPYNSSCNYFAADVDGDGLDELMCAAGTVSYYTHKGGGSAGSAGGVAVFAIQIPDLASSITDGYGNSFNPLYVSLSQANYTRGSGTALPLVDANDAIYAVGRVLVSDANGGTFNIDYTYKGARRNTLLGNKPSSWYPTSTEQVYKPQSEGQWAGFEEITTLDSRLNLLRKTTYEQMFPLVGFIKSMSDYQSDHSTLMGKTVNTNVSQPLDSTTNNQRFFAYSSQTVTDEYEVGGTQNAQLVKTTTDSITYTDFTYGNPQSRSTTVTDKDSNSSPSFFNMSWTNTIAYSYDTPLTSGSDWCVGFLTQTVTTESTTVPGAPSVVRTLSAAPDTAFPSKCRLKVRTTEPASSQYRLTETFTYDAFGNVSAISKVGRQPVGAGAYGDMAARTSSIDWGITGQFPSTITDATNKVTTLVFNYDAGTLKESTDPNLLTTSYAYDAFNRRTRVTSPDGTYNAWVFSECAPSDCANDRHVLTIAQSKYDRLGALISNSYQYLDAMERPLVTRSRLLNGTSWDGSYQWLEYDYDSLGRRKHDYVPCQTSSATTSCAMQSTTYTYDDRNRLTQSSRPRTSVDNTLQTIVRSYAGRTQTSIDALGMNSVRIVDVDDNIRQIRDANNFAINFDYDAAGSIIGISDSNGYTRLSGVVVDYGIAPFQVSATDSALGPSTQTFNSFGELVGWTDGKGQLFSATYDALSRPLSRIEPGALPGDPSVTTTWTWGASSTNKSIGKLETASQTVNGQTYTESNAYDSLGRIAATTFQIPNDGTHVYSYGYEPDRGWLDTLEYPVSTGSYRLKLRYAYQNGVLQQVSDANSTAVYWTANYTNARGQTTQESLGSGVVVNRTFDAVTSWLASIQAGPAGNPTSLQNISYLYDLVGNVTQRQNNKLNFTESFYYGSAADNLYRLDHSTLANGSTTVTNLALSYDLSGNILGKSEPGFPDQLQSQAITWTSYNYPQQITTPTESATFSYGPDRSRWKMYFTRQGKPDETTLYIGDFLEKITIGSATEFRHTIYGGTGPVAIYTRQGNGTNVLRYILGDNQGSIETITDGAGAPIASQSFTAHGERRDPSTLTGPASNTDALDAITRQGYTFQTVLGSMGLNHMNGRVQDARNGRFLSPDPFVSDPGYTQNYNRYSYVFNNPLTFIDPSGFDCENNGSSNSDDDDDDDDDDDNHGYQNGSTTAQGMQGCMPEIVVTAVRSSCMTNMPGVCSYSDVMREFVKPGLPAFPFERMMVVRNGQLEEVPLQHKVQKCSKPGGKSFERSRNTPVAGGLNFTGVSLVIHSHGNGFDPRPGGMDATVPMNHDIPAMSVHDSGAYGVPAGAYVIEPPNPNIKGDTVHFVNVKNSSHLPGFPQKQWEKNATKSSNGGDADANAGFKCVDVP